MVKYLIIAAVVLGCMGGLFKRMDILRTIEILLGAFFLALVLSLVVGIISLCFEADFAGVVYVAFWIIFVLLIVLLRQNPRVFR